MNKSVVKRDPNDLLPIADADLDDVGRINYYNDLARKAGEISIRAAIGAGIELRRVQGQMLGSFTRWVDENCKFSRSTAYKYIALATSMLSERPADEVRQIAGLDAQGRAKYVTDLSGGADGRSLSALYSDYGIVKHSKMGGKREGAGRKKHISNSEREELAVAEITDLLNRLSDFVDHNRHLLISNPVSLSQIASRLRQFATLIDAKGAR